MNGQETQEQQPVEALKRYGRDLTELARTGKLDPVIGRDEEILPRESRTEPWRDIGMASSCPR